MKNKNEIFFIYLKIAALELVNGNITEDTKKNLLSIKGFESFFENLFRVLNGQEVLKNAKMHYSLKLYIYAIKAIYEKNFAAAYRLYKLFLQHTPMCFIDIQDALIFFLTLFLFEKVNFVAPKHSERIEKEENK